tara:strand:+ start:82 stop:429 length:348 start_codon:yes stop_codon:yes gene_type:complete
LLFSPNSKINLKEKQAKKHKLIRVIKKALSGTLKKELKGTHSYKMATGDGILKPNIKIEGPKDKSNPNKKIQIIVLLILLSLLKNHPKRLKNGSVIPIHACLLRSAQKGSWLFNL